MKNLSHKHYDDITRAIDYLCEHHVRQPELGDVAQALKLSPSYTQKLFSEYVGVSPKQFLKYISVEHAKNILHSGPSLLEAAHKTGLSGTGRLHDLFVTVEAMTPGQYKSGGEGLTIHYSFADSPYGELIIASTEKGICHMTFITDRDSGSVYLQQSFPHAVLQKKKDPQHTAAIQFFSR